MAESLYIILGPPRSGVDLLSRCLDLVGLHPPEHELYATTINNLLFHDLGLSPYTLAMPQGWLSSEAASKAKNRIAQLVSSQFSSPPVDSRQPTTDYRPRTPFISDPLLCHTLPLWQQEIGKVGLDPRCIFIIRHPFETAMSLHANHGLNMQIGHILWMAHTRAAMRAFEHQPPEKRSSVYSPLSLRMVFVHLNSEKGVSYDKRDN